MQFPLIGFFILALWGFFALRGVSSAVRFTLLMIPLGATSVIELPDSGMSLLALQVTAALTTGVAFLFSYGGQRQTSTSGLRSSVVLMGTLCVYGAISAFIYPRLFFDKVLVVPYTGTYDGQRVSEAFSTTIIPLSPVSSNISQPAYLAASLGFFMVLLWIGRIRGAKFLSDAFLMAAVVNIAFGVLDYFRMDIFLEYFRTADYAIFTDTGIMGADRLIGGFPEPAAFGATSITFAAYGLSRFIDRNDKVAGAIGLVSAVFGMLALSTTAIFGAAIMFVWLFARIAQDVFSGSNGKRGAMILLATSIISGFLIVGLSFTPFPNYVMELLNTLVFSKADSSSGLERGFWAASGFRVFFETYGLGAGLGSVRSNGLLPVMLANIGLIGLVLFLGFLWSVFLKNLPKVSPASSPAVEAKSLFRAASAGAVVNLAMAAVSGVLVDPGITFFTFAAIAVIARDEIAATILRPQPRMSADRTGLAGSVDPVGARTI
jgi:hypothetical protein